MNINDLNNNPVFKSQQLRRKTTLVAAFAAAACSVGVMVGVAQGKDQKVAFGMGALGTGLFLGLPRKRGEAMGRAVLNRTFDAMPLDAAHPYQSFLDNTLQSGGYQKPAKVYTSDHMTIVITGPASIPGGDVYFSNHFDRATNDETKMKAIIGHEAWHIRDTFPSFGAKNFCNGTILFSLASVSVSGLLAPVVGPLALTSIVGVGAVYQFNKLAHAYISRRTEHMADIHAMYSLNSKHDVQAAIAPTLDVMRTSIKNYIAAEKEKDPASTKAGRLENIKVNPPGRSVFNSHPEMKDRVRIMDEAAKYMP